MWKVIIGAVLIGVASYWAYEPVPYGAKSPWKFRLVVVVHKILDCIARMFESLGISTAFKVSQWIMNHMALHPPIPGYEVKDMSIEGVPVRIFRPQNTGKSGPGVLFFHGGGWTLGSSGSYHEITGFIAKKTGVTLVSVDYRLAPEHIFPSAFEDCLKVSKYFLKNANTFGVDPQRIAVAGDSAGGNLAVGVAYKLRDERTFPNLKLQIPIYPVLQAVNLNTSSYIANQNEWPLHKKLMVDFFLYYAVGNNQDRNAWMGNLHTSPEFKKSKQMTLLDHKNLPRDLVPPTYVPDDADTGDTEIWNKYKNIILRPEFSPLLVDSFKGMPEALVVTVQRDVLRDDGLFYVNRLKADGILVKHIHHMATFHGCLLLTGIAYPEAIEILNDVSEFINEKL